MSTIFISHSSKDNDVAQLLKDKLQEENHPSVFLDLDPEKGIKAGQSWERTLYRKLVACRAVVALCTDNYLSSHWCFAEIALARMMGKHLIALQVDGLSADAKLPSILMERQFIDLRGENKAKGWIRLWEGLREEGILGAGNERHDPKKDGPYLGLATFEEKHSEIFFGRESETRAGIEALGRGAPGLIMVLGASGSGKSSLVRAGMVPRLRANKDEWLVVNAIRPATDPFAELAKALESAYATFSANQRLRTPRADEILRRLRAGAEKIPRPSQAFRSLSVTADDDAATRRTSMVEELTQAVVNQLDPLMDTDERLPRLISHLEALRENPPEHADDTLLDFLEWSVADLRSIANRVPAGEIVSPNPDTTKRTPLLGIARHLRRLSGTPHARVLIIVDQFEELLGHKNQELADKFLRLLRVSIEGDQNTLMVLGTMRSDFLGTYQRNASLRGVEYASLSLGPMQIDGLQQVIEKPARLAEVELGPGVTAALLRDTETPDALPLLSFTLWKLHKDYADDNLIDLDEYERQLGGIRGAISKEADEVAQVAKNTGKWKDLGKAFLKMARLNEDKSSYARQTASLDDPEIKHVEPILRQFEKRRLVVFRKEGESEFVEVAHEALFRSWEPLKKWLDDNRTDMLLKSQIARDARDWRETNFNKDTLWRGARLLQARELLKREGLDDDLDERFVRQGMRRRFRAQLLSVLSLAAVFATVIGAAIFSQLAKRRADDTARVAMAGEWLSRGEATNAALTLLEVNNPEDYPFATTRMADALDAGIAELELRGHPFPGVYNARFDPTGTRIVTAGRDGRVMIWDAASGTPIDSIQVGTGDVAAAMLHQDGRTLIAAHDSIVQLWILSPQRSMPTTFVPFERAVNTLALSPTGDWWMAGTDDGNAYVMSVENPTVKSRLVGHRGSVLSVAFNADGRYAVTGGVDSTARIWDVETGRQTENSFRHNTTVYAVAFSEDASRVVVGTANGTAFIWDVGVNDRQPVELTGHRGTIHGVDVNASGVIATAGFDHTVMLWDITTGKRLRVIRDHREWVLSAAFDPSGHRLVTASDDLTARVWNTALRGESPERGFRYGPTTLEILPDSIFFIAFDSTSTRIVVAGRQTAVVWDLATDREATTVVEEENQTIMGLTRSGNDLMLLTADDTSASVKRFGDTTPMTFIPEIVDSVPSSFITLSRDKIVTMLFGDSSFPSSVTAWDANTLVGLELPHDADVYGAVFSPSGAQLVTTGGEVAYLWDAQSGQLTDSLVGHNDELVNVAYSSDGALILTTSDDFDAIVWDATSHDILRPLQGHRDGVSAGAFSEDGQLIATGSWDWTVRLWHTQTGMTLWTRAVGQPIAALTFSPDGQRLAAVLTDGTAIVWDIGLDILWPRARSSTRTCLTLDAHKLIGIRSEDGAARTMARCKQRDMQPPPT